jgi:hypothetical protein
MSKESHICVGALVTSALLTGKEWLTVCQSQKIFTKHFTRRLLVAHNLQDTFSCTPNCKPKEMVKKLLQHIGHNQGVVTGGKNHVCKECCCQKCYYSDLLATGHVPSTPAHAVAQVNPEGAEVVCFSCYILQCYSGHWPDYLCAAIGCTIPPSGR